MLSFTFYRPCLCCLVSSCLIRQIQGTNPYLLHCCTEGILATSYPIIYSPYFDGVVRLDREMSVPPGNTTWTTKSEKESGVSTLAPAVLPLSSFTKPIILRGEVNVFVVIGVAFLVQSIDVGVGRTRLIRCLHIFGRKRRCRFRSWSWRWTRSWLHGWLQSWLCCRLPVSLSPVCVACTVGESGEDRGEVTLPMMPMVKNTTMAMAVMMG